MQTLSLMQYSVFLVTVCAEGYMRLRNDIHEYKVKDTLANMSIAIASVIVGVFLRGTVLVALLKLQQHSLFRFETSLLTYTLLFILSDLFHYSIHYLEHKCRFFWATHSIHHSSPSYNFSIAFRTAHTNTLYKFFYEAPLCLLGFDAYLVVMIHNIILFFGFFQHTELVKKLGWLEFILNTPSHHRVHHASNKKYLDKNFGGVLIIWDKLFGTFQAEEEPPVYGLTKPINTYNPIKIVFHEWNAMAKDVFKSRSWKERIFYIFNKPGWKPIEENRIVAAQLIETRRKCINCAECAVNCNTRLKELTGTINFRSPQISLQEN